MVARHVQLGGGLVLYGDSKFCNMGKEVEEEGVEEEAGFEMFHSACMVCDQLETIMHEAGKCTGWEMCRMVS
jgi:hypothetical protein